MSAPAIRWQVGDFLDVGESGTPDYALMGPGFISLDENPNAQVETTPYISDRSASTNITGYQYQFDFSAHLMYDERPIAKIMDIPYRLKTGGDAQVSYLRVDYYKGDFFLDETFPARLFRASVQVTGITGAGTAQMEVAGTLGAVGDPVFGTFNKTTRAFTPESEVPTP